MKQICFYCDREKRRRGKLTSFREHLEKIFHFSSFCWSDKRRCFPAKLFARLCPVKILRESWLCHVLNWFVFVRVRWLITRNVTRALHVGRQILIVGLINCFLSAYNNESEKKKCFDPLNGLFESSTREYRSNCCEIFRVKFSTFLSAVMFCWCDENGRKMKSSRIRFILKAWIREETWEMENTLRNGKFIFAFMACRLWHHHSMFWGRWRFPKFTREFTWSQTL